MFDHRSAIMVVMILLGLAVLAHTASAQFAGDLFFKEPSIAVAQNHTGRLTLQAFAGSDPLGAVHVELVAFQKWTFDQKRANSMIQTRTPSSISLEPSIHRYGERLNEPPNLLALFLLGQPQLIGFL